MKTRFHRFLFLLLSLFSASYVQAQSLADVLSSIQERHVLISQRDAVDAYFSGFNIFDDEIPASHSVDFPDDDTYISWVGASDYPSSLNGLGMADCVRLLNQAVKEFDDLKFEFLNINSDRIEQGASHPGTTFVQTSFFTELDLPSVGLVTPSNYQSKLQILATQVQALKVTWWPVFRTRGFQYGSYDGTVDGPGPTTLVSGTQVTIPSYFTNSVVGKDGWIDEGSLDAEESDDVSEDDGVQHWFNVSQEYTHQIKVFLCPPGSAASDAIAGKFDVLHKWAYSPFTERTIAGMHPDQNPDSPGIFVLPGAESSLTVAQQETTKIIPNNVPDLSVMGIYDTSIDSDPTEDTLHHFVPTGCDLSDINRTFNGVEGVGYAPLSYVTDTGNNWVAYVRRFQGVFSGDFTKGLDAAGDSTIQKLTSLPASQPACVVNILPDPAILMEINLGVGSEGPSGGNLVILNPRVTDRDLDRYIPFPNTWYPPSIEYTDPDFASTSQIISTGAYGYKNELNSSYPSLSSDLLFTGPREDFVVVGDDGVNSNVASAVRKAPDWYGQTFQPDRGWFAPSFLRAWHRAPLRQIIGRNIIADIDADRNRFSTTIRLYHRDPSSPLPTNGEAVDVSSLTSFVTYTIDSGGALTDDFPDNFFGLKVARSGGAPATDYILSTSGTGNVYSFNQYSGSITSSSAEVATKTVNFDEAANTITFVETEKSGVSSTPVSRVELTKNLSTSTWFPKDLSDPGCLTTILKTGTASSPIVTTFTPNSRFPTGVVVNKPDAPDYSKSWNVDGFPIQETNGAWTVDYTVDGGGYEATSKLSGSAYGRTWVSWADEGSTVTMNSAPTGSISSKTDSSVATTVYSYERGGGASDGALPWGLVEIDSPGLFGTTNSYQAGGSGSLVITTSTGKLNSSGVVNGQKSVTTINRYGFTESQADSILPNFPTGGWSSTGALSSWGGPQTINPTYPNGLENSQVTWESSVPAVSSTTSSLGLNSSSSNRDWLFRPTGFSWDGHSGGTIEYNKNGLGISSSINIGGRPKGSSHQTNLNGQLLNTSTVGNQSTGRSFNYGTGPSNDRVTVTSTNGTLGLTQTTNYNQDSGALLSLGGNASLPATAGLVVDAGMLRRSAALSDTPGAFQNTWTDAWGRVRKVEVPTTQTSGSGNDVTNYEYSAPGADVTRVIAKYPSKQWWITEHESFPTGGQTASGQKSFTREGLDVNKSGTLGAGGDRFTEIETISGTSVTTTVSQTVEGPGSLSMQEVSSSVYNIATGDSTTTLDDGEEVITSDLRFGGDIQGVIAGTAYQTYTSSTTKGWSIAKDFDHKGLLLYSASSGTGMPSSTYTPTWHSDGSMTAASMTVGGTQSSVSFAQNGAVSGFTDPIIGTHAVTSSFGAGEASFSILTLNLNSSFKFNGTQSEIKGENVVDEMRTTTLDASGFTNSIKALDANQTTSLVSGPSGAPTAKNYEAGPGIQNTWLAGGLVSTVSRARGGNVGFFYTNDGARDLREIQYPAIGSGSIVTESFTYGADGNTKTITDLSGSRIHTWDRDRLEIVDYANDGKVLAGYEVDPQFDGQGRRTGVSLLKNGVPIHSITYARGNGNSGELTGVSSAWMSASYARDPNNRWITGVDRGGPNLIYQRDGNKAGRLARVESTVAGAPSFKYQRFDKFGRRKTVLSSQGNWSYQYGVSGQLTNARNSSGPNFNYTVDAIGRRSQFMSSGGMGPSGNAANALNQPNGSFGDNPNGFLGSGNFKLNVKGVWGADLYVNDQFGTYGPLSGGSTNFEGITSYHWSQNLSAYPYGGWHQWSVKGVLANQGDLGAHQDAVAVVDGLTWITPTYGSFSHDADGNRESAPGWEYIFDGRNRLVEAITEGYATNPSGKKLSFEYDAEGRRVEKSVTTKTPTSSSSIESTVTAHFVWDGWDLLYECHQDDQNAVVLERRYVWGEDLSGSMGGAGGAGGLLAMQVIENGTTASYYPLYDGSGNVVGLADQAGTLVAEYRYGPFGELIEATGPAAQANPWRFATKYEDLETRLVYFGHRYFDPVTGAWLSREPLGEAESLNLYAYCHGDPINHVDYLGLESKEVHATEYRKALAEKDSLGSVWRRLYHGLRGAGHDLNPADPDSNLRKAGLEMEKNIQLGREGLKEAPPVFRQIGEFTLGFGDAGNPVSIVNGGAQIIEAVDENGLGETVNGIVQGMYHHATQHPFEFGGNVVVPSAWARFLRGNPHGFSSVETNPKFSMLPTPITGLQVLPRQPGMLPGHVTIPNIFAPKSTALKKFYPDNNGFVGETAESFLYKGQKIDRYGGIDKSRFFSPQGTPDFARALPPGTAAQKLRTFEVVKPFPVQSGQIAPAFGQIGGGTQMVSPLNLKTLLNKGILKEITR